MREELHRQWQECQCNDAETLKINKIYWDTLNKFEACFNKAIIDGQISKIELDTERQESQNIE